MKILLFSFLVLFSCTKNNKTKDELSFEQVWEKYHLLCNYNMATSEKCAELVDTLNQFQATDLSDSTLQQVVKQCDKKFIDACSILTWYFVKKGKGKAAISFGKDYCPQSLSVCFNLGEAYSLENQLEKSLSFFEHACLGGRVEGCERIGHYFLGEKSYRKAAKYFKMACALDEPISCYNLACTYSLLEEKQLGLNALEKSFKLGFKDWKSFNNDRDLDYLKKGPEIQSLLSKYKRN